jgi:hypothetical protein
MVKICDAESIKAYKNLNYIMNRLFSKYIHNSMCISIVQCNYNDELQEYIDDRLLLLDNIQLNFIIKYNYINHTGFNVFYTNMYSAITKNNYNLDEIVNTFFINDVNISTTTVDILVFIEFLNNILKTYHTGLFKSMLDTGISF